MKEQLEFAKSKVPEKERSRTRVYLMATAGLRRLDKKIQDAVLDSCRAVLRASGFLFQDEWASVITGTLGNPCKLLFKTWDMKAWSSLDQSTIQSFNIFMSEINRNLHP